MFFPPDHTAGDANTIGGYQAVHSRPAGFEGKDGAAYSVEIVVDETGDPGAPYAGYLLFVRWRPGDPVAAGHLETNYLVQTTDADTALARVGAMSLSEAKQILDALIDASAPSSRPWYEAMRDA
ncbi:MAG TPA: hypothetical protein VNU46_09040 [Gemmatimonadaceae bacterium]|jgi:hypothetical protein|nr:hypothetical protein [Gemmatimonadaceae bacterium]